MQEPEFLPQISQILMPCSRLAGVSNSPEFEFCSSSFSPPYLLSADQLFSGGVLLPLHHLCLSSDTPPPPQDPEPSASDQARADPRPEVPSAGSAQLTPPAPSTLSFSRRLSDIFRRNNKKSPRSSVDLDAEDLTGPKEKDTMVNAFKEKRRERKNGAGGGPTAAELNINIWPFSRSRSAGNGASRPRTPAVAAMRKASSAPCSRSNSASESKSRRWPSSPARGVHVGRSSPVWKARRGGGRRSFEAAVRKNWGEGRREVLPPSVNGGGLSRSRSKSLSLNIPTCIGYKQHSSCRSAGIATGEGVRRRSLFNIKSLFTKKVY